MNIITRIVTLRDLAGYRTRIAAIVGIGWGLIDVIDKNPNGWEKVWAGIVALFMREGINGVSNSNNKRNVTK